MALRKTFNESSILNLTNCLSYLFKDKQQQERALANSTLTNRKRFHTSYFQLHNDKYSENLNKEILKYLIKMSESRNKVLKISIEGNIASGKSTIIDYLSKLSSYQTTEKETLLKNAKLNEIYNTDYENENDFNASNINKNGKLNCDDGSFLSSLNVDLKVIPEPVDLWRNLNGSNLLEMMYQDPTRWTFAFQSYVQLTMFENHKKINTTSTNKQSIVDSNVNRYQNGFHDYDQQINNNKIINKNDYSINIIERSIYSARYCFLENLIKSNILKSVEYEILDKWFNWMVDDHDCKLDIIFYLRTSPEICLNRLRERARPEEVNSISIDYLRKLHNLHETWLVSSQSDISNLSNRQFYRPPSIIVIDADKSLDDVYRIIESETRNAVVMSN